MDLNKSKLRRLANSHLTNLIKQKIRNHKETYDYRNWNREWKTTPATTDSVIKFMFGLNSQEEINYFRFIYQGFMTSFLQSISRRKALMLKFFRFYMSLPVFEYEYKSKYYERMSDMPPYRGSERTGSFIVSMCDFKYEGNCLEIEDKHLKETMNEICKNEVVDMYSFLCIVREIETQRTAEETLEPEYIINSRNVLFKPLCKFLAEILNQDFILDSEKLKDPRLSEKTPSTTKVDLGLYVPNSLNSVYSCVEFKQFPISPIYFGPNGKFDLKDLFGNLKEGVSKGGKPPPLRKFLRQVTCEMLSHKCNRGILTDSYTYIFLEIDLTRCTSIMSKYSGETACSDVPREIPINYTVKSCHSANVTLRQTLLDFLNKSHVDGDKIKEIRAIMTKLTEFYRLNDEEYAKVMKSKRARSSRSKLSESFGPDIEGAIEQRNLNDISSVESSSIFSNIPSSKESNGDNNALIVSAKEYTLVKEKDIIVPPEKFDILKHGYDRYSQVYSVEASYLSEFLKLPIQDTNRVAIKIHDPWYYPNDDFILYNNIFKNKQLTRSEIERRKSLICKASYRSERLCYGILEKDPKFNSIAYEHENLKLSFCCQGGFFRQGMTNIFKFIETQEMPRDQATYQKAAEQLEIIHKNGIVHNDISERNLLYSTDGKVFIIDYSFAYLSKDKVRITKDKEDLKSIFL